LDLSKDSISFFERWNPYFLSTASEIAATKMIQPIMFAGAKKNPIRLNQGNFILMRKFKICQNNGLWPKQPQH
jgi:hypothetical protein